VTTKVVAMEPAVYAGNVQSDDRNGDRCRHLDRSCHLVRDACAIDLRSIAGAESRWTRTAMFKETAVPERMMDETTTAGLWHPWLRITRVIEVIRSTRWNPDEWPTAKAELGLAYAERRRLARAGWCN
jgi:hypothetical protein